MWLPFITRKQAEIEKKAAIDAEVSRLLKNEINLLHTEVCLDKPTMEVIQKLLTDTNTFSDSLVKYNANFVKVFKNVNDKLRSILETVEKIPMQLATLITDVENVVTDVNGLVTAYNDLKAARATDAENFQKIIDGMKSEESDKDATIKALEDQIATMGTDPEADQAVADLQAKLEALDSSVKGVTAAGIGEAASGDEAAASTAGTDAVAGSPAPGNSDPQV